MYGLHVMIHVPNIVVPNWFDHISKSVSDDGIGSLDILSWWIIDILNHHKRIACKCFQ